LALVIGINEFASAQWPTLEFAVQDAEAVGNALQATGPAKFDLLIRLVRPDQTTRAEIWRAVDQLARENSDPDDVVLIYFSTHGTLARDASGELRRYLVARDTEIDNVARTGLALAELKQRLNRLQSRKKVLVLASCHSGAGKSDLPRDIREELIGSKADFSCPRWRPSARPR